MDFTPGPLMGGPRYSEEESVKKFDLTHDTVENNQNLMKAETLSSLKKFTVDDKGKLSTVSGFGHFFRWIKNLTGREDTKVMAAMHQTIEYKRNLSIEYKRNLSSDSNEKHQAINQSLDPDELKDIRDRILSNTFSRTTPVEEQPVEGPLSGGTKKSFFGEGELKGTSSTQTPMILKELTLEFLAHNESIIEQANILGYSSKNLTVDEKGKLSILKTPTEAPNPLVNEYIKKTISLSKDPTIQGIGSSLISGASPPRTNL